MTRTILMLMSDTGGGHRAAAEAVREAIAVRAGDLHAVAIEDVFAQSLPPARYFPPIYQPLVDRAPWAWAAGYHASDGALRANLAARLLAPAIRGAVGRLLAVHEPALVASFHPLLTQAPARLVRRARPGTPFVTVVTDLLGGHASWYYPEVDRLVVPTEGAAEVARSLGVSPGTVRVTGQPIALKFAADERSREDCRRQHGLDLDRPLVLVVGGGEGMGGLEAIARAIAGAGLDVAQVVIAGRNAALQARLEALDWAVPTKVTGFVTDMPGYMRAADVLVTKAGPGTVMEAVASGLPMILSGHLPGQEAGNVRFVESSGVGVLRTEPAAIAATLAEWLAPGGRALAEMRTRALAVARPRAALEVADILLEVAARPWT